MDREWLEEKASDLYVFAMLLVMFAVMFFSNRLTEPWRSVAQWGAFLTLIASMFLIDILIREKVNKYPYIQAIVRPINRKLHLFVKNSRTIQVGDGLYSTTLELAFPVAYLDYGKVRSIIIHHVKELSKRLKFDSGWAVYKGMAVRHPQVEYVELYQVAGSGTAVDHAEVTPVFYLRSASQDFYMPTVLENPVSSTQMYEVEGLRSQLQQLQAALSEAYRRAEEWHQRALSLEEENTQLRTEIRGLLDIVGRMDDLVRVRVLSLYQAAGDIEGAAEMVGVKRMLPFKFGKYLALTVIAAMIIAYLWFNPELVNAFAYWLRSPLNSFLAIAALGLILTFLYYYLKRRRRR